MTERTSSLAPASSIPVSQLLRVKEVASLTRLVAGATGLSRRVAHPRIQKSGLVLVGHSVGIVPSRVQILGETEISYLESLDAETRAERARGLFQLALSLVVVTRGVAPLPELLAAARETETPLVISSARSSRTISALHGALDVLLAPQETVHGVLIDVHGIGTLLRGPSGIGKSECALFLVERGHRLVADDQVILKRDPSGTIIGEPPALLRHHLEVRGIGILNVRELFGATAVRERCEVQLVVELRHGSEGSGDRLGLDPRVERVLATEIPKLEIPVQPGRNMAVILEVAARNELLKRAGYDAAERFVKRLEQATGVAGDGLSSDAEE